MGIRFTKIVMFFSLCIAILVFICPPSLAVPRRVEECGIENYISKADPACGVASYISTRSPVCGVQSYKEMTSLKCPGSTPESAGWYDSRACPQGYTQRGSRQRKEQIDLGDRERRSSGSGYITINEILCVKPGVNNKCRLAEFGVEQYNVCRNPAHGVEAYNTCSRSEFGVAQWKKCEIRKTKDELTAYIQSLEPKIDLMGVTLIQNTGSLLTLNGSEIGMACYIKRWDSDPLYKDAIEELKTIQFPALFGVSYNANSYDCSNQPALIVSTESCSDGTPRCKFQTAYNAGLKFFEINKAEVVALLNDIVARTESSYKIQLENLNTKLDNYYKPPSTGGASGETIPTFRG